MIQDFQQTTIASIGLLARANCVCCGYRLRISLQQQCRACQRDSWNCDADSAVVSVFASPANRVAVLPRPRRRLPHRTPAPPRKQLSRTSALARVSYGGACIRKGGKCPVPAPTSDDGRAYSHARQLILMRYISALYE